MSKYYLVAKSKNSEDFEIIKFRENEIYSNGNDVLERCFNLEKIDLFTSRFHTEEKLRKMVEMVKEKGMMNDAIFQCSIVSYLKTIKKYAPNARIWYLRDTYDSGVISKAKEVGAEAVNINYVNVDQNVINELHNANLRVGVYVIPSTKVKEKFLTYKADYIMSNKPV